jgi:hypothetical protein
MDYLDFIARIITHIPDKGQVMIRYYALYSNAYRARQRKQGQALSVMPMPGPPPAGTTSPGWRELIKRVYQVDPLICPKCQAQMKVSALITNYESTDRIINHLGVTFRAKRPPPPHQQERLY